MEIFSEIVHSIYQNPILGVLQILNPSRFVKANHLLSSFQLLAGTLFLHFLSKIYFLNLISASTCLHVQESQCSMLNFFLSPSFLLLFLPFWSMISIFYDVGVVSVTVVCRSFTVPSVVCLMQMEFFFFTLFFCFLFCSHLWRETMRSSLILFWVEKNLFFFVLCFFVCENGRYKLSKLVFSVYCYR